MENLEDKFVAGEWIPPFIESFPAPKMSRLLTIKRKNLMETSIDVLPFKHHVLCEYC